MEEVKCNTCGNTPKADCDYRQGRCPHRTPLINVDSESLKHRIIVFVKSALRFSGYFFLAYYEFQLAALLLVAAEVLNNLEDIV